MPNTPNYTWVMPTDGGSADVWGDILNTLFLDIDTDLKAVSDNADSRLLKAGGTMTGRLDGQTITAALEAKGSVSGAVSLAVGSYQGFTATIGGATTFTFATAPAGVFGFVLKLTGGSIGVTWPASVDWPAGAAPTLSAGVDILGFLTFDSGTIWYGIPISLAAA